jgi:uncharacterized membrane protein YcaP (DUF421 family)
MLILSETVSPALTDSDTSLPVAAVASGTLMLLTIGVSYVTFRYRKAEKLIQGEASVLIDNGRVCEDVLRRERMTNQELSTVLHKQGILAVKEVKKAFLEPSGDVSIIKKGPETSS